MSYSLKYLQAKPTIETRELKVDLPKRRVWLSNTQEVVVEALIKGQWVIWERFMATDEEEEGQDVKRV